jgi:hypothetical protein
MKMTVPPLNCLWDNISGQNSLSLQMKATSTDSLSGDLMDGPLAEIVQDGGISSSVAKSMFHKSY